MRRLCGLTARGSRETVVEGEPARAGQSGGPTSQPVVVAGAMVDLSASSLAAKGSSKNPFGAPATSGKHQWDKPKPNVSLNDLKQGGGTGGTF